LELKDIPPGSAIHNIELVPNTGGKLARFWWWVRNHKIRIWWN
jgi:hypothetical protein